MGTRKRVPAWARKAQDGLQRGTDPLTPEDFIRSFRDMAIRWSKGLDRLRPLVHGENAVHLQREYLVAAAIGIQFSSAANVIEFYTLRDRLLTAQKDEENGLINQMLVDVQDDIKLAHEMQNYVEMDSVIGFESEMYGYSYSPALLDEKVKHDSAVVQTLIQWQQTGADKKVLLTKLPAKIRSFHQEKPTWRQWLRWGD
jgi:hypothetical protein